MPTARHAPSTSPAKSSCDRPRPPISTITARPRPAPRPGRDGLVSVGDVGYLDEDGYLFLCDRKRDMVISGGVNIYPAEIENALIAMPGVRDCAVFGVPDDEFGERLFACIEQEPGAALSSTAVQDFLRGRLANFKVPKDIQFFDGLPREASGKIFKRKLRDLYREGSLRAAS